MSGSSWESLEEVWEALPDVRELSGDPPGCSGVVRGPHECLGVVGRPSKKFERHSRMSLRGGRQFRMSGSCREALADVQECSKGSPKSLEGPSGCLRVVEKPSRMSLWRPFRMSGRCRRVREWWEVFPNVREW